MTTQTNATDFITLSCPTCGGKLQITNEMDRFACAHCGQEHIVRRSGGAVYLAPLVEGVQQVRVGVDKTAAELAIARLRPSIAELEQRLASLEAASGSEAYPASREERLSGIVALVLALPATITVLNFVSDPGVGIAVSVLLFAGSFAWALVRYVNLYNDRIARMINGREDTLRSVREQLSAQRAALERNMRVVNSQ